jgi:ABC-type multidrug transport system permease subunit
VNLNGPYAIANAMGLLSLGTAFSLTLFCAQSVLRDDEHQMTEIIYSTAVTKRDLLFGRFLGSFLAAVLAFAAAPVGMTLGALASSDAERVGPFALVNYAWPFAVLALPSMFFVGALLSPSRPSHAASLATYVAGVAL